MTQGHPRPLPAGVHLGDGGWGDPPFYTPPPLLATILAMCQLWVSGLTSSGELRGTWGNLEAALWAGSTDTLSAQGAGCPESAASRE